MLLTAQLIIFHLKLKVYKNIPTAIARNKQNMFIAILSSFFIFFGKNSSRSVSRTESNIKDKAFWEKHCQPFTIYTKSSILDIRLSSVFAKDSLLMLDWVLDDASGMFKERQKMRKTCIGVIFRNAAAKTKK